ncbi:MAG: GNAT family N-acetyltransferase [Calditrichae bacterium]|nr:GNAT family N-acetyltransferase [Calditrichia bacterium]
MEFKIRNFHPSDLSSLYRICLLTADSGRDGSKLYKDADLVGQFYAAPYAILEPDLCFVATADEVPCGYILGTRDSQEFYRRCENEWFPVLRKRYPVADEKDSSMDARIIRLIHTGHKPVEDLLAYPAHLHIDLLPIAQGQGMGRKLISVFSDRLKHIGVPALHLQVGKSNEGAVKFYKKVGFHVIKEYEFSIAYGIKFN